MGQYDDLITSPAGGRRILEQLYPNLSIPDCPAAADAVDDYLNTGRIVPTPLSLGSGRYSISATWRQTPRTNLITHVLSLGPNHHVVVRGTRTRAFQNRHHVTSTHYFVLANIAGRVYVVDAMTQEITTDVTGYLTEEGLSTLHFTRSYQTVELP